MNKGFYTGNHRLSTGYPQGRFDINPCPPAPTNTLSTETVCTTTNYNNYNKCIKCTKRCIDTIYTQGSGFFLIDPKTIRVAGLLILLTFVSGCTSLDPYRYTNFEEFSRCKKGYYQPIGSTKQIYSRGMRY